LEIRTNPSTRTSNAYWFAPVGIKLPRFALQALLRGQKTVKKRLMRE